MNPWSRMNGYEKTYRFISYLLVFLMMACAVMALGSLMRNVLPHWHSGMIASVLLFIGIDRLYTFRQLKSLVPFSKEWLVAFGAQWLLILLVTRFLLSYAEGLETLRTDLSLFARGYMDTLLTPEFVISVLLALLVWYLCGRFLYILDEVGLDPVLASQEEPPITLRGEVPPHQQLVSLIFGLGIGLVILTVMARLNLSEILSAPGGIPRLGFNRFSGGEAGALFYFVFGLALLSLSRLMSLQAHWNRLRIPISSRNLTRQWGMYSLFFFMILAVVISLLPTGGSMGLFSLLATLIGFLAGILFFIAQLIFLLLTLVLSIPLLLLRGESVRELVAPPPFPDMPMAPAGPLAIDSAWDLIQPFLLWGLLIVIIVFSFTQFVRQHDSIRQALRRSRIRNWLVLAWQWLYKNVDRTRDSLSQAITATWQTMVSRQGGKRLPPRPAWISVRSLDPRRQIYFFYLAMIRRTSEEGLQRKPSQTPAEYAAALEKALPSSEEDIESLTRSFVEARYSRHDINASDANDVRRVWGRIRRALQDKFRAR